MVSREKISGWQLAVLFQTFLIGSAIINIPQPLIGVAKNAAWMSLLLASGVSFIALTCILYLHRKYPKLTFIEQTRKTVGNRIAVIIIVPFLSLPLILLPNMIVDIGSFFTNTMMIETPGYVFNAFILLTAAMTVRAGIEVMARMFTLLAFIMFVFVIIVLLLLIPHYHLEYLSPVLPNGFKPVLHGGYLATSFPFADVTLLSMILPFIDEESQGKIDKLMYLFLSITSITLIIVTICTTMVLGPLAGELKFSVFQLARLIQVTEGIERIESIIGIVLITSSYMKVTLVLFVLALGISQLLKLQNDQIMILPITWITLLLSLTMYENRAEFIENVSVIRPLMSFAVAIVPLVFITLLTLIKNNDNG
ncbi:endospore germination permease [Ectobacillus funiculus]|uniref:GerAB/ArcD/ProY family transporter n=1 Tax=Ectobacillus funiculus TaxID=137993 RepID=UPI003978D95A